MIDSYASLNRLDPFVQLQTLEDGELNVKFTIHATSGRLRLMYHVVGISTFGLFYLLSYWLPQIYVTFFTNILLNKPIKNGSNSSSGSDSISVYENSRNYLFISSLHELKFKYQLYVFVQSNWNEKQLIPLIDIPYNGFVGNALPVSATHSFFLKSIEKNSFNLISLLSFNYRSCRYVFDILDYKLVPLNTYKDWNWTNLSYDTETLKRHLDKSSLEKSILNGLDSGTAKDRHYILGENNLDIPNPSTVELLIREILHPFYIFQLFSIGVWLLDNYYFYAGCIFIISFLSSVQNLMDTRRNYKRLEDLSRFTCKVNVLREGIWKVIQSEDLVQGDIYKIPLPYSTFHPDANAVPPCDSVLLNGDCVINESALTGESIPVSKVGILGKTNNVAALRNFLTSIKIDKGTIETKYLKHCLFSGTKIIQGQGLKTGEKYSEPLAMAIRTGFQTTKGILVRSMLHPKPHKFKFYEDSFKFIGIMACVAFLGFIYTTISFIRRGETWFVIFLRGLDLVTITVPPALPATMSIGISFALARLRKKNIFCISPNRINVAGQLNIVLFDKTGTLTVEGLKLLGAQESITKEKNGVIQTRFDTIVAEEKSELLNHQLTTIYLDGWLSTLKSLQEERINPLLLCMASCHSLKSVQSHLLGDPLEVEMYNFTGAKLENDCVLLDSKEIVIHQVFDFDASLRRMSVIVKIGESFYICTKGAPEVIKQISISNSRIKFSHSSFRLQRIVKRMQP
eukprot:NODE_14_length_51535_cov_1.125049.p3 type:complete len:740 gc:universal NODE_14_length_51535_cov_1.125049:22194-19975(-)